MRFDSNELLFDSNESIVYFRVNGFITILVLNINRMKKLLFTVIIIVFSFEPVYTKVIKKSDYSFRSLDTESGLSQNAVLSILQDRKGFMWFGTKDGLNRYDGNKIKIFKNEIDNPSSLGNNTIWSLLEQSDGTIWVGTEKGIYILDTETERFSLFEICSADGEGINHWVTDMKVDKNGNIWIAAGKLFCYILHTKELRLAPGGHAQVWALSIDNNDVWVSTLRGGIYRYNIRDNNLAEHPQQIYRTTGNTEQMSAVCNLNSNHLLIGTFDEGVKILDKRTGVISHYNMEKHIEKEIYVRSIGLFSDGNVWVGTQSGLYIHDPVVGTTTHLYHNLNDGYSIPDNAVYSMYEDREGGIWVGTYFGGVCYYQKNYIYFWKDYPISNENSIIGERVSGICEDDEGNIWIGTEDAGLCKLDPETYRFEHFKPEKNNTGLNYENVHDIVPDGDLLWIATFSHGINVYNKRNKTWKHYRKDNKPGALVNEDIFALYKDSSGNIWVGTSNSTFRFDRCTEQFTYLMPLQYLFVSDIIEDARGNIWFATYSNGAYRYNPESDEYTHYAYDSNNSDGICHYKITCMFVDSKKRLWFASESRGICMFDDKTETFIHYGIKDGFVNDVIYMILEDDDRNLWLSSNAGLMRFNPETKNLRLFTRNNGLPSNQFNYKSGYKDKNGRMYFGTVKGMISFHPSDFNKNEYVPPVAITDFKLLNDEGEEIKYISSKEPVILNYNQSSFTVSFASLSYVASEMNEYRYKMEGADENWNHILKAREITYSNLPHGKYIFRVKGSNNDGVWNETGDYLQIIIRPPFWLSKWAYVCYTLLIIAFLLYFLSYYKKRIDRKNSRKQILFETRKEKEIYHAKIDFFTNVAHEVRTPLTLIKGPLEYILNNTTDEKELRSNLLIMEKNTDRLLSLINQLLDFRKTETKGFSLSFTRENVCDILHSVYVRFKPVAERKSIRVDIEGDDRPVFADLDKEALTKIISNLFTNAVKYAENTIIVEVKELPDNRFSIRVNNDGPLIPPELREKIFEPFFQINKEERVKRSGSGIGLALVKSLVDLHKGEVFVDIAVEGLNSFVIILPTDQENVIILNEHRPLSDISDPETEKNIEPEMKLSERRETILLVEDNKELLWFISGKLERSYGVFKAVNGVEALRILEKEIVDIVISDIMMPQMDGFELCKYIKESQEYSHIPVILLTAKTNIQNKIEGLELGADAYIEKPFSLEYLQVRVENLLDNRRKIRKAFTNSPLVHTGTIAVNKADEQFLTRLTDIIYKNMANADFNVDKLAEYMFMSRSSLLRKIKGVSEISPNDFIKLMRLKRAAEILQEGEYKVNEVCFLVGFSSTSYFSKAFQKQFGVLPKDFAKGVRNKV